MKKVAFVTAITVSYFIPYASQAEERVCFYQHINYEGANACWRKGEDHGQLQHLNYGGINWNDQISSLKIYGALRARICKHENFGGECFIIRHNQPDLRSLPLARGGTVDFNDQVTAIEVY